MNYFCTFSVSLFTIDKNYTFMLKEHDGYSPFIIHSLKTACSLIFYSDYWCSVLLKIPITLLFNQKYMFFSAVLLTVVH
jgi:hypothetical protein